MAFAVPTIATTSFASGTTVTIPKPSGLSVGDLMVATLGAVSGGSSIAFSTLSGWSLASQGNGSDYATSIQYKIADAGDVAASNFTFTCTSASHTCGAILRATGPRPTSVLAEADADANTAANSATLSFTAAGTPIVANSLVVMSLLGGTTDGTGTISSYTTTPSVMLTELLDTTVNTSTRDPIFGAAYGIYSGTDDITQYGATFSGSKEQHFGALAIFTPQVSATGSNALFQTTPVTFATLTGSTQSATNALHTGSPDLMSQSGVGTTPTQWVNETSATTEWTNET
jgi:hypothetical protein